MRSAICTDSDTLFNIDASVKNHEAHIVLQKHRNLGVEL